MRKASFHVNLFFSFDINMVQAFKISLQTAGCRRALGLKGQPPTKVGTAQGSWTMLGTADICKWCLVVGTVLCFEESLTAFPVLPTGRWQHFILPFPRCDMADGSQAHPCWSPTRLQWFSTYQFPPKVYSWASEGAQWVKMLLNLGAWAQFLGSHVESKNQLFRPPPAQCGEY